jgi:ABC-type branched-subunit amino acid transport system substrate-binding protein
MGDSVSSRSQPCAAFGSRSRRRAEEQGDIACGSSPLNDATRFAQTWAPERASANARRAARNRHTIGYIGELNSGASAISIPILNEAGVPQISPANEAIGLTRGGPGSDRGEPEKYYPVGTRTFFRLATSDRVQGGAMAAAMRNGGCDRIASLTDGELYGSAVGYWLRHYARSLRARVVAARRVNHPAKSYRPLAQFLRGRRPELWRSPASPRTVRFVCLKRSVGVSRGFVCSAATASPKTSSASRRAVVSAVASRAASC